MSHRYKGNAFTALIAMIPFWIMAAVSLSLFCECRNNGNDDVATPRRIGYPRIRLCDTLYKPADITPLHIEVNAEAIVIEKAAEAGKQSYWFDIDYPAYNGTIYCTLSQTNRLSVSEIIANRLERISLNLGNEVQHESITLKNGNISSQIVTTQGNMVSPIMFIATDNQNWVFSGTFNFNAPQKLNYDSVAPIINAVKKDIVHTINSIKHER